MNKDRVAGAAETLAGRATTVTGQLLGDDRMVARGDAHQLSGKLRNMLGTVKDMLGLETHRAAGQPVGAGPLPNTDANLKKKDADMNGDRIEGSLRDVKGKVEKGVGDVTSDTKWQADGVIDQVAGSAQNLYGRAKDKVQDALDDAPDTIADATDRIRDVASRGRTLANDQVKANPWVLVAAAGIAGYALSWLLHGKQD